MTRPFVAMPYPGIARITTDTPFPGLDHVHVYVARGPQGGIVVFDTSVPFDESYDRIIEGLATLDRTVTDIERIYLTHAHPDHIGNAARLQEASGAEVVCHPLAHEAMQHMQDPSRWIGYAERYAEHGRDPQPIERSGGFSIPLPDRIVEIAEEDTVSFDDAEWEILWTPGHEHGHIVFHRRSDGVTIVGDTVLGKITPHIGYTFTPEDPLGQFLDSLERVAELESMLLLPMHGRPLDEGAERAMSIHSHHQQRLRRCMEILMRSKPMHAMDCARTLFSRQLMMFEERLAMAETLSHLEYLRLRGRLEREQVDGVWLYGIGKVVG